MRLTARIATLAVIGLLTTSMELAAQAIDASGHYEGAISSPAGEVSLQVDLSRTPSGEILGTLTIPAQKLKGFPLTNIVVKGKDVSFDVATSGGGYFRGELSDKGISGDFSTEIGPFPLDLQRAGEPRLYPPPKSAPIGKELEGVWSGTLDVDGGMRVILKLANQADGTSTGTVVSVDENNMTIPVAVAQEGGKVTLTLPMTGSSYSAAMNAAGTELTGTWTTSRGLALPLTFKRGTSN